ncbi:carboxylate--amine ligase [candidate division KSB1 bacterium]|nr:carboxylate--amine ligase [candidate division KSB1 bacterium]NIR68890.1 carboxylate--amine ligase [candidate division KSB1 bacterium]NIS22571.1 carboxylate--amine ligase [candidate division KSB1 bacterium]NIT69416.1 carboxylate--amine ligase [candidate division KSB1 bacterium]NIU23071.1 carboxylate--amine ligase [candidate division KSB1 bacterium]
MQPSYKNIKTSCAIVIGLDSVQGLQSARILAQRNVQVIAIAKDPKYYSCRTRVCQDIIFSDTNSEELIESLIALGARLDHKAVLFPCQDESVLLVSRHRRELESRFHVVLPAPETVELLMHKASFYRYAQKKGLAIPQTFILETRDEAERAAQSLQFPCILKPSFRSPEWNQYTSQKAFKVLSCEELLSLYEEYHGLADVLIAQDWIDGVDTDHFTCNCYFDAHSNPLVTFTSKKIRQWPPETGQACLAEEFRNDAVLQETLRLYQGVKFRGLSYLEMKRDRRSGQYFMIEPNVGRPTGRAIMAEAGGIELLYTMYCDAIGLPLPENREQKFTGVKWIHELRDIQSAMYHWRQGNLTLTEWRRSLRGQKTRVLFSWRDPLPFFCALLSAIPTSLSSRERMSYQERQLYQMDQMGGDSAKRNTQISLSASKS